MLLPVLIVSSLVHLYSISYMAGDPHNQRFLSYLSMFTFFMLVLVAGDNYFIMFVGWEYYVLAIMSYHRKARDQIIYICNNDKSRSNVKEINR